MKNTEMGEACDRKVTSSITRTSNSFENNKQFD